MSAAWTRRACVALALVATTGLVSCARMPWQKRPPGGVAVDSRPDLTPADSTGVRKPRTGSRVSSGGSTTSPMPGGRKASRSGSSSTGSSGSTESGASNGSSSPGEVGSVMSGPERRAAMARIVADTTGAGAAVRKCGTRQLLPDQESVWDTTRSLLAQTRAALERDELWRAESLARKARQLAASLSCP